MANLKFGRHQDRLPEVGEKPQLHLKTSSGQVDAGRSSTPILDSFAPFFPAAISPQAS